MRDSAQLSGLAMRIVNCRGQRSACQFAGNSLEEEEEEEEEADEEEEEAVNRGRETGTCNVISNSQQKDFTDMSSCCF